MDESKQPGIRIESIFLGNSNFSRKPFVPKDIKLELKISKEDDLSEDKKTLITNFILEINTPNDPVYFICNYVGIFKTIESEENMSLDVFRLNNAPAILYPYLREEFQNRISKASLDHIVPILPPLNLNVALQKKEEIKSS